LRYRAADHERPAKRSERLNIDRRDERADGPGRNNIHLVVRKRDDPLQQQVKIGKPLLETDSQREFFRPISYSDPDSNIGGTYRALEVIEAWRSGTRDQIVQMRCEHLKGDLEHGPIEASWLPPILKGVA
jgi:hypothetical protein